MRDVSVVKCLPCIYIVRQPPKRGVEIVGILDNTTLIAANVKKLYNKVFDGFKVDAKAVLC